MEEVEIKNVGGPRPRDGVASEATLAELLETIKNNGRSTGTSSARAETRAVENFTRATRESAASQGLLTKAVDATETALDLFQNALKNNTMRLSEFTESLIGNGNLIFRTLNRFNYFIDENIDRWRSLSQVGASFGNSLNELVETAVDGRMTLDEFSQMVLNNSEVLRSLSGTVTEGSKRFASLSRQLRASDIGRELYSIGFSFEEVNETLLNYIDISRRSMSNQRLTDRQLMEGTAAYVDELERLTKITGMSRREAQQAMAQQMQDQRIRMRLAQMAPEEAARFQTNMAYLDNQVSGMGEVFRQLASMDPGDELSRLLQVFVPDLAAGARDIQNMSTSELHNFIASFGDQIDTLASSMGEQQVAYLYRTNSVFREMFNMASQANRLSVLTADERQRLDQELASRSSLTTTFANFEEQIRQITGDIVGTFFNVAGQADGLNSVLGELARAFIDLISPQAQGSINSLTGTFSDIIQTVLGPEGPIVSGIRRFTEFLRRPETASAFNTLMNRLKDFSNGIVDFLFGVENELDDTVGRTGGLFSGLYAMFASVIDNETTFSGLLINGFKGIFRVIGNQIVSYFGLEQGENQGPWSAILDSVTTSIVDWVEGNPSTTDNTDFWSRLTDAVKTRVLNMFGNEPATPADLDSFWTSLWNRVSTSVTNWFNSDAVQAELTTLSNFWNEITTVVGDGLLWLFGIDRVNAGTGRAQTFWEAVFREIDQVLFGRLEAIQTPAGTVEVRDAESGLIFRLMESIRNLFADDGVIASLTASMTSLFNTVGTAFTNFWEGETGREIQTVITNFFTSLLDQLVIAIENSALGWVTPLEDAAIAAERRRSQRVADEAAAGVGGITPISNEDAEIIARTIRDIVYEQRGYTLPLGFETSGVDFQEIFENADLSDAARELFERFTPSYVGMSRNEEIELGFTRLEAAFREGQLSSNDTRAIVELFRAIPEYNTGTIGFKNFGKESLVKLHGYEAVVPRDTLQGDLLSQFYAYQTSQQIPLFDNDYIKSSFFNLDEKISNSSNAMLNFLEISTKDTVSTIIKNLDEKISDAVNTILDFLTTNKNDTLSTIIKNLDEKISKTANNLSKIEPPSLDSIGEKFPKNTVSTVIGGFSNIEKSISALSKKPETDVSTDTMNGLIEKIIDLKSDTTAKTPEIIPIKDDSTQSELIKKIDELNKTMLQVVSLMSEELQVQKKTLRGVHGMGGDLMKGIAR